MTTALQNLLPAQADELVGLAKSIRLWQEQRDLSDNELLRKLPSLGSTKTYTRLLKGDTAELDLDRWISQYRSALSVTESMTGREQADEELYDDVSTVVSLRRSLVEILECRSIRRVILVEGDSGLGKSSALTLLQTKYGQRVLVVEACDAWADNPMALLGAILEALGVKELAMSREGRLRQVVTKLKELRVAIAIDEAHHMGPHCLNTCKTLINQTPCEIILLALPTLWRKLERTSYEEVKQLLGNRLSERIKVEGLRESDVKKILVRRAKVDDAASVKLLLQHAPKRGNMAFVAAVCERLKEKEISGTPSREDVAAAVAQEMARR